MLTQKAIWEQITKIDDPLVITPLLDHSQVGDCSVDVRLGHQFIILRKAAVTHVDPTDGSRLEQEIHRTQNRIRISRGQQFVIHPGQLVLGATLEYISMPKEIAATVEGRSSWGRLGLIIATACSVAPGFKGCITLELVNDGEAPLVLYPGIRIAQLLLFRTDKEADYHSQSHDMPPKYDCPIGPQFSRIGADREISVWANR